MEEKFLNKIILLMSNIYYPPVFRLLDFTARPIHVAEPDGNIILEGATEAMDKMLYNILDENATSNLT